MKRRSQPPGFRFQPTHVELVMYYLKNKVMQKKLPPDVISELDIYKYAPWDLPVKSCMKSGDLKWYFFCPREKKYASGARINRATDFGFWKSTGKDRPVVYFNEEVGQIKTLTFFRGKAPKGETTDWVMHEYRIDQNYLSLENGAQNAYVLCVIFQKDGPGPRNGAQYGAPFKEEDWNDDGLEEVGSVEVDLSTGPLVLQNIEPLNSFAPGTSTTPSNLFGCSSALCISEKASTSKEIPQIATLARVGIPQNLDHVDDVFTMDDISPQDGNLNEINVDGFQATVAAALNNTYKNETIYKNLEGTDWLGALNGDENAYITGLEGIFRPEEMFPTSGAIVSSDPLMPYVELNDLDAPLFPPYMELNDLDAPLFSPYQNTQMLNSPATYNFCSVNEQQYFPFNSFDATYDPGYAHMSGSSQVAGLRAPNHFGFNRSVNIPPNSNEGCSNGYQAPWPDHDWNPP